MPGEVHPASPEVHPVSRKIHPVYSEVHPVSPHLVSLKSMQGCYHLATASLAIVEAGALSNPSPSLSSVTKICGPSPDMS